MEKEWLHQQVALQSTGRSTGRGSTKKSTGTDPQQALQASGKSRAISHSIVSARGISIRSPLVMLKMSR